MSGRIEQTVLDEILSRINIVEIISGYIPLKRAGRNFKASCPFHHEKTPSFMISVEKQIYHCFGCGAGGNAINFLMQYERLEFYEAVKILAAKAGVVLPQISREDRGAVSLGVQLNKVNELTAAFYMRALLSDEGRQAKEYLLRRGIREDTIKTFKIGYACNSWDALLNHLRAKNIPLSLLEKCGVILPKSSGGYYDRFRHRIVFSIDDIKGRTIAFGARVLDDSLPKYINSPETPLYSKGKNLYGFHLAKDAIRDADCAIIVEGYLDVILPFQEGARNIVASLGTALTVEQVRLLKRYTQNVVMVYDPDTAGQMATVRSLDIFIEEDMQVKIVSLPSGFDPDLFVREKGVAEFNKYVAAAERLLDYKLSVLCSQYNPKEIEGKARISDEMLRSIRKFKSAVMQAEYVRQLAETLHLKEESLLIEMKKIKDEKEFVRNTGFTDRFRPCLVHPTAKLLIKFMLQEKDSMRRIRDSLDPEDFQDERLARIIAVMFELFDQGKDIAPNRVLNCFSDADEEVLRFICESSFDPDIPDENRESVLTDCILRLKGDRMKRRRLQIHQEIKEAQKNNDDARLNVLMQEFQNLIKRCEVPYEENRV